MINLFSTIIRLALAFILGGVIGLEREKKGVSAGLRTHILVTVGAALIMLTSLYIYGMFKEEGCAIDPGRIAAGVVTGVGFLGAGTIIRSKEGIRGLTTAASIWISAAIGLAVGCGYFSAAIIVTGASYLALSILKKLEKEVN
ncbi:MAG: MgtC/SapB family protein [Candidatus Omnitrophica bacterium]|nr:MgtC/SapB family protein [Candidatus Omnitrophota bacterium]